eukprot:scaffold16044_cov150-Isochrysis_galbana.AAC.1
MYRRPHARGSTGVEAAPQPVKLTWQQTATRTCRPPLTNAWRREARSCAATSTGARGVSHPGGRCLQRPAQRAQSGQCATSPTRHGQAATQPTCCTQPTEGLPSRPRDPPHRPPVPGAADGQSSRSRRWSSGWRSPTTVSGAWPVAPPARSTKQRPAGCASQISRAGCGYVPVSLLNAECPPIFLRSAPEGLRSRLLDGPRRGVHTLSPLHTPCADGHTIADAPRRPHPRGGQIWDGRICAAARAPRNGSRRQPRRVGRSAGRRPPARWPAGKARRDGGARLAPRPGRHRATRCARGEQRQGRTGAGHGGLGLRVRPGEVPRAGAHGQAHTAAGQGGGDGARRPGRPQERMKNKMAGTCHTNKIQERRSTDAGGKRRRQ